jgi:hypothetical protein
MQADEAKASDGPIMMATTGISIMRVVIVTDDTNPTHVGFIRLDAIKIGLYRTNKSWPVCLVRCQPRSFGRNSIKRPLEVRFDGGQSSPGRGQVLWTPKMVIPGLRRVIHRGKDYLRLELGDLVLAPWDQEGSWDYVRLLSSQLCWGRHNGCRPLKPCRKSTRRWWPRARSGIRTSERAAGQRRRRRARRDSRIAANSATLCPSRKGR